MCNHCIVFFLDNHAVVNSTNKQTSREPKIMVLVRKLELNCLKYNILFKAKHIPGILNQECDLLSRLQVDKFTLLHTRTFNQPDSEQPTTAELEANLKCLMHSATSPGSHQTYKAWNHFLDVSTRYCGTAFQQLPLGISDIVLFVAYLSAKKLAPSTISTYISALSYVRKNGYFSDPTKAFVVQKITTVQSKFCSKLDIRLPITRSILHKLVQALNHTITPAYQILLIQTMFLVAFYGFFLSG